MNLLDLGYLGAGAIASPYLAFKAATDSRYRHRLGERFGAAPEPEGGRPRVWFHASSVGETALLKPMVAALREKRPGLSIAVSTTTIAGRENAEKLFPDAPVFYFPLDFSFAARRALRRVRPDLVALIELEVWPNFTRQARKMGIPLVIVNGRISDRSFGRYRKLSWFFRPSFRRLGPVGAQNETVAERMRALGAADVRVTGNLKFDRPVPFEPEEERVRWLELLGWPKEAPVLVAGSTHDPEERIAVEAFKKARSSFPGLRLLLAPRHLNRVAEVEKIVEGADLRCYKKSQLSPGGASDGVAVLDTVGDLARAYSIATVVLIGGTFGSRGGQNMLEPAAIGKPILSGPNFQNFREEGRLLAERGGMLVLDRPDDLAPAVKQLLCDGERTRAMGEKAREVVESGRGALGRTVALVESVLDRMKS